MGSLFRSEEMALCQLFLQSEAAYACVSELGELGLVQFRDLNPDVNAFQRKFVNEVRRCDEMERKLRFLEKEIKKDNIPILDTGDNPEAPQPREMIDLEATFEKLENELREVNNNAEALKRNFLELSELKQILRKTQVFFDEQEGAVGDPASLTSSLIPSEVGVPQMAVQLGFVAGVILRERIPAFERMLWRACRGNVFLKQAEIEVPLEDPHTGDEVYKSVFIIFFQGEQLKSRVKKICEGFRATLYPCPETPSERREMAMGVMTRIEDLNTERSGSSVPPILNRMETKESPPTYNRSNKFTTAFQSLVDAYGVAAYREVNPAPFTIITFPFLFAVMFGDAGHGAIMAAFGGWMVWKEKQLIAQKSNNEIWKMFFGGRYIILLMGLFSIYTGLIYNDIFSKSLNIFGSSWYINYDREYMHASKEAMLDPGSNDYEQTPYPFGMDPIWQVSNNKINFLNSYKMKISIIFGVCQMFFGVVLSYFNHRSKGDRLAIVCEWIPQVLFLLLLFGYLVILVFNKWVVYSAMASSADLQPKCAPSLLITLINMVLLHAPDNPVSGCSDTIFAGQDGLQKFFVTISLLCMPWMLFAKPYLLYKKQQRQKALQGAEGTQTPAADELDIGDVFVHQAIHTIEYCLGSVSHTASYLRLWALSLAHAQLSEVLWSMVMRVGLIVSGWVGGLCMYVIFSAWAALTVGVLVLMEGLSAFLHTLRLHWVEFQSKFYAGTGHLFVPFSFETMLENARAAEE